MSISRNFMIIGALYLIVGVSIGMYMGGSGDHSLVPVHAHINLLGFTLMSIFGLAYRVVPALADNIFGKIHFWFHQVGTLVLIIMLALLLTHRIEEAAMAPLAPLAEGLVFLGVIAFAWNLFKNA